MAGMETAGRELLARAGYERYEISAYARPGARCRHNLAYWTFADYIGIGPGAHGKRSGPGGTLLRTERIRSPARWLRLAGRGESLNCREVTSRDRMFEYMLGTLRLTEGFAWADFERLTGLGRGCLEPSVSAAVAEGLLARSATGIRPTSLGLQYLNELQARFLPA